jgi:hypothetical protein
MSLTAHRRGYSTFIMPRAFDRLPTTTATPCAPSCIRALDRDDKLPRAQDCFETPADKAFHQWGRGSLHTIQPNSRAFSFANRHAVARNSAYATRKRRISSRHPATKLSLSGSPPSSSTRRLRNASSCCAFTSAAEVCRCIRSSDVFASCDHQQLPGTPPG